MIVENVAGLRGTRGYFISTGVLELLNHAGPAFTGIGELVTMQSLVAASTSTRMGAGFQSPGGAGKGKGKGGGGKQGFRRRQRQGGRREGPEASAEQRPLPARCHVQHEPQGVVLGLAVRARHDTGPVGRGRDEARPEHGGS